MFIFNDIQIVYFVLYFILHIVKEFDFMERNFPVILSELRKEKGLSQKEAASQLGISQALLSHYEKGIRECSHEFLIRVADFYGVSCDYLLGRSNDRSDIQEVAANLLATNNDFLPTSKTAIKAAMILREAMNDSEKLTGIRLDMLLTMNIYQLLLIQAGAGNIPKNWAGKAHVNGDVICSDLYLDIIDTVYRTTLQPTKAKNPVPDEPVPEAVATMVKMAEDYINEVIAKEIPKEQNNSAE